MYLASLIMVIDCKCNPTNSGHPTIVSTIVPQNFVMLLVLYNDPVVQIPQIIAHRGASHAAPENTLASFELAWAEQADAIECDVRLTLDGQIAVIHDSNTFRTTRKEYEVAQTDYSALSKLNANPTTGDETGHNGIPLLSEVLQSVPGDRLIVIEVKCGPEIVPALLELLEPSSLHCQATVISFNWSVLAELRKELPGLPMFLLSYGYLSLPMQFKVDSPSRMLSFAKEHQLQGFSLFHKGFSNDMVSFTHSAGMKLSVWTVDNPDRAVLLAKLGVDFITTNCPAAIRSTLLAST